MRSRATISHQRMDLQDKDHRIESVVYQSSFWKLIFQWHLPLKIFQSPHRFFQLTSRRPRQLPSDVEFQCLRIQCRATTRLAAPSRVVLVDHAQWSRGLILIQFPGGEIVADTSSSIHTAISAMKEKKTKLKIDVSTGIEMVEFPYSIVHIFLVQPEVAISISFLGTNI